MSCFRLEVSIHYDGSDWFAALEPECELSISEGGEFQEEMGFPSTCHVRFEDFRDLVSGSLTPAVFNAAWALADGNFCGDATSIFSDNKVSDGLPNFHGGTSDCLASIPVYFDDGGCENEDAVSIDKPDSDWSGSGEEWIFYYLYEGISKDMFDSESW